MRARVVAERIVAASQLDEGVLRLSNVKAVEIADSWDLDVEGIYRRHMQSSTDEMSVPVFCWKLTHGTTIAENECLYFMAPQKVAECWIGGLHKVRMRNEILALARPAAVHCAAADPGLHPRAHAAA